MSAPSIRAIIAAISTVIAIPFSITFLVPLRSHAKRGTTECSPSSSGRRSTCYGIGPDLRPPSNPHPRTAARQALLRTLAVPMRASRPGQDGWAGTYSGSSRFHRVLPGFEEGPGTNPEELLAAAHAACFTMALALAL